MHTHPTVVIVILNWNGRGYLDKFLPSVLLSEYPGVQIMIADNGSTDDSVSFLSTHFPTVKVLTNPINEGFAKGYNTALDKVNADYYVLLNSDVEVTPGWITPVIQLLESNKMIGACQPKILSYNNKAEFEYAGASGGWIDKYGYPFSRGRLFETCEVDQGQYDDPHEVFWASGAAMFIRSDTFHKCGGFDEFFFAHQEEIDLCWRMKLSGYKIYVHPSSVVYHVGGGTLPMGDKRKVYLNFRNNLVMIAKNTPILKSAWKIPLRIALDNLAAIKSFFSGKISTPGAIFKAHLHFIRWIFSTKVKRFLPIRRSCNLFGLYNGSVVWEYFIRNKRKFSEIIKNNGDL